jgi:hypothetical protein
VPPGRSGVAGGRGAVFGRSDVHRNRCRPSRLHRRRSDRGYGPSGFDRSGISTRGGDAAGASEVGDPEARTHCDDPRVDRSADLGPRDPTNPVGIGWPRVSIVGGSNAKCARSDGPGDAITGADARPDAGSDGGSDGGSDSGPDGGPDGAIDCFTRTDAHPNSPPDSLTCSDARPHAGANGHADTRSHHSADADADAKALEDAETAETDETAASRVSLGTHDGGQQLLGPMA